jgi:hypothetical protein
MTVRRPGHHPHRPRMRQSCHGQRLPGALSQRQWRRNKRSTRLDLRRRRIAMGPVFSLPAQVQDPAPRHHAGAFA